MDVANINQYHQSGRLPRLLKWGQIIVLTLTLLALCIVLYRQYGLPIPGQHQPIPVRMPAGKPLLEPDRPDLIGDPGIVNEEDDDTRASIPNG